MIKLTCLSQQRWVLAEILKASSISPLEILRLIQGQGVDPNWVEMLIPNGMLERTLLFSRYLEDAVLGATNATLDEMLLCVRTYH